MIAGRLALPYLFFLFLSLSCHFFASSYSPGSERSHAAAAHPHPIPLLRAPCAPHGTSGISSRPPASEPHPRPSDLHQPQPGGQPASPMSPPSDLRQQPGPGQRASPSAPIGPPAAAACPGPRPASPSQPAPGPRPSSPSSSLPPAPASQTKPARQEGGATAAGKRENPKTPEPQNPRI